MGEKVVIGKGEPKQEDQPKIVAKITFNVLENGSVTVDGPIKNGAFTMDVIGKGLVALGQFQLRMAAEGGSRILRPDMRLVSPH